MSTNKKIKWAILVSGWGRNARDLIKAFHEGKIKKSNISLVIFEAEPCGAANLAKEIGIETLKIVRKNYKNETDYQKIIIEEINKREIDYIFLLAYKYKIKEEMLNAFPDKILNIHPSLFPSFLGTKTAIQDALDYGVRVTGITTHIIDHKLDEGTILNQATIKIKEGDNFDTLYPKFAKKGEKLILKTIKLIEGLHFKK